MAKNPKTTTPPPKTGQSGFKISFSINNNKKTNTLSNTINNNKDNSDAVPIKTDNENTECKNDEDDEDDDDDVIKKLAFSKSKKNKLGFKSFYKVPSLKPSVKQEVDNKEGGIKDENNNTGGGLGTQGVLGDWQSLTPKKGWKPVKTTVAIFGGSDNQHKTHNTGNDENNNNNNDSSTDNDNNKNNLIESEGIKPYNTNSDEDSDYYNYNNNNNNSKNNNSDSDENNKDVGSSDWKTWLEGPMESDDSGSERGLLIICFQVFWNFLRILYRS